MSNKENIGSDLKEEADMQSGEADKAENPKKDEDRETTDSRAKEKVREKNADFGAEFEGIKGCAVLYDPKAGICTFYNETDCREQVSPCSTFKIVSALMGLHNQAVTSEDSRLGYDGTAYAVDAWNGDLTLKEAFQNSCVWYFRKLVDGVGREETQKELDRLGYGNCDISQWEGNGRNSVLQLNGFWLESSLNISPLEQVEVLEKLFEGKSIYTQEEVEIVKNIMLTDGANAGTVYGKTGTGTQGNAWYVGFQEREASNLYFAVFLNDVDAKQVSGDRARKIALRILESAGD